MKKGKLQINYQLCSFPFEDFLASAGRVAVTEGGDLGGLGVIPQQAFWPEQSGQNRKTCICLHCLPVCEKTCFYEILFLLMLVFFEQKKYNRICWRNGYGLYDIERSK